MSRRKVAVSQTTVRPTLGGGRTVTRYRYTDDGQPDRGSVLGRIVRWYGRLTGVRPWNPLRFALFVAVGGIANGTVGSVLVGIVAAVVAVVLSYRRWQTSRPVLAPVTPIRPIPGPLWCDHCADWTVHPTEQHRIAA